MKQQGVSLMEVLIALTVLAFGLLGVAAMQVKALQSASEGYQHSVAAVAAMDAQERIWYMLSNYASCEAIEASAVTALENAWIDKWSSDESANPLRGANWQQSELRQGADCEFTILIVMTRSSGNEEEYRYRFVLPNTAGSS